MYRFREPVSGFTHLAGAILGVGGMIWLIALTRDDPCKMVSMIVYSLSLIILYSASATLHLVNGSERTLRRLRRCDHAAIYLMMAGTCTPIIYNVIGGEGRWIALGVIWALAACGIVYKLCFPMHPGLRSLAFYVAMGWASVLLAPLVVPHLKPGATALILAGGLVYSAGAVVFGLKRPNLYQSFGFHELWHLFVIAGSGLHFLAVLHYIA